VQEFILKLTWVDYLTFLAVLRGCYVGFKSGFFPELLRIVSYLTALVVTFRFQGNISEYLTLQTALNETTAQAVSFCLLFLVVLLILKLLMIVLLRILKIGDSGLLNKLVGVLMGSCRWILILSLFFLVIVQSPLNSLKSDIKERSLVGPQVLQIAPEIFGFLSSISPQLAPYEMKE
jgi:uncharacterized membrane protein required for colicin V production